MYVHQLLNIPNDIGTTFLGEAFDSFFRGPRRVSAARMFRILDDDLEWNPILETWLPYYPDEGVAMVYDNIGWLFFLIGTTTQTHYSYDRSCKTL